VSPTAFGAVGRPSIVIMALPTTATAAAAAKGPDANRGKQLYLQTCGSCHGPDGNKIANLELKAVKSRMNAEQIAAFIVNPAPPMPKLFPEPRTADDDRDIEDVAAFVASWPP
jgi:mono/diheme cytochrome c family protein